LRSDPNAFEKGDRPSVAAVGVFPDGNLCKTQGYAVSRFRNKARLFAFENTSGVNAGETIRVTETGLLACAASQHRSLVIFVDFVLMAFALVDLEQKPAVNPVASVANPS
jgi:hypothetical protein